MVIFLVICLLLVLLLWLLLLWFRVWLQKDLRRFLVLANVENKAPVSLEEAKTRFGQSIIGVWKAEEDDREIVGDDFLYVETPSEGRLVSRGLGGDVLLVFDYELLSEFRWRVRFAHLENSLKTTEFQRTIYNPFGDREWHEEEFKVFETYDEYLDSRSYGIELLNGRKWNFIRSKSETK